MTGNAIQPRLSVVPGLKTMQNQQRKARLPKFQIISKLIDPIYESKTKCLWRNTCKMLNKINLKTTKLN